MRIDGTSAGLSLCAAALTALLSDGDVAKKRKFLADSLPDVSAELEAAIEAACTERADG